MSYKKYTDVNEFIKELLQAIDFQRSVLLFAQNRDLPDIKSKSLKGILKKNLKFIVPYSCSQDISEVDLTFTYLDPLSVNKVGEFCFCAVNITSFNCYPVLALFYFNEDNQLLYYVPTLHNTLNPISMKPYGLDESDQETCMSIYKMPLNEFLQSGRWANLDLIVEEMKRTFGIPEYSIRETTSIMTNCENLISFTTKTKKKI